MPKELQAFQYKLSLGQNFIFDQDLLGRLLDKTPIAADDVVLEIGAGRGDLSLALAQRAKQVICIEIDPRLEAVLQTRFEGLANTCLVMGDVMELDLAALMAPYGPYYVVANLPYYLTTPILTMLFHLKQQPLGINVMVQKEAAQRVMAEPGTPAYGPLAVWAAAWGTVKKGMDVPAGMFTPPPKVDSVFLVINRHPQAQVELSSPETFHQLVKAAFSMRRKTLLNNLLATFSLSREQGLACLEASGLPAKVRGEQLDLYAFAVLSEQIAKSRQET